MLQVIMRQALLVMVCVWIVEAQTPAKTHYLRGIELLRNQNPSEAVVELDQALKLDPRLAEAHHAKGLARLAENNPAAAAGEFRRAIQLKPDGSAELTG